MWGMKTSIDQLPANILDRLKAANTQQARTWPGEPENRQPVHTVYGGANLFKAGTAKKMGELALASMKEYAPDAKTFASVLGIPGDAQQVYDRVQKKLASEAVEDFRIDFEDGYGNRPDAEEDGHAAQAAG